MPRAKMATLKRDDSLSHLGVVKYWMPGAGQSVTSRRQPRVAYEQGLLSINFSQEQ